MEPDADGRPVPVGTVFLTGRECPWRCVFCDLWKHTIPERTPRGAIPAQLDAALPRLRGARWVKLYNAGSFFDTSAVPPDDLPAIASRARSFERVIVECHPSLVRDGAARFRDLLGGPNLEVAMGLETVHPEVLPRLGKRMTLSSFARAASLLSKEAIALRAFVLVGLPLLPAAEAAEWAVRSASFAFDQGATVVSLIPVRGGDSRLDGPERQGRFTPPSLGTLEAAVEDGVRLGRGRVLADLWDLAAFSTCPACFPARQARLLALNLSQAVPPPVACASCTEAK